MTNAMKNKLKKDLLKVKRTVRRLRWKKVAITAFSIAICISVVTAMKPIYVPDKGDIEREEMTSYYKQQEADSAIDEARREHDEKLRAIDRQINDDVSSIWEAQRQQDRKSVSHGHDCGSSDEMATADSVHEWTETEIDVLVLAVQHEVGTNPGYYPNCQDFDKLQRAMCRVIYNRIGKPGFGNTLQEVLLQKNQFTGLIDDISHYWEIPNSEQYNPKDERTRANVMAVINGTDGLSSDIYFERCSLRGQSSIYEAWEYVKSLYASPTIALEYYEETSDGRFIMFISNPNGAY